MDRIESLGNTISNITLYDIKSMYTQVRSVFARTFRPCYLLGLGGVVDSFLWIKMFIGKECRVQCQRDGSQGARSHK